MPVEEYTNLTAAVLSLSYQQRLSLLSLLAASLQEKAPAPASVTVDSVQDLQQKLQEGLDSMERGRAIPAEEVHRRLQQRFGA